MPRIPTKVHAVLDYAGGAALLAAPTILRLDARSTALVRGAAAGQLVASALTDYELGVKRVLPMKAHLGLDAATGAAIASSPWWLRTKDEGILGWLPHLLGGATEIAAAVLTQPQAGDRQPGAQTPGGLHGTGSPTVNGASAPPAPATSGPVTADRATPPPEVPGPSVTAPEAPMSTTEREERADALKPEHLPGDLDAGEPMDDLVEDEAAAAAAEAAMIGGPAPRSEDANGDPAMRPVYEAGGGEQEGFEAAEQDLIENATHGDGGGDPLRDAFPAEAESDRSTAEYGEPDEEGPHEQEDVDR